MTVQQHKRTSSNSNSSIGSGSNIVMNGIAGGGHHHNHHNHHHRKPQSKQDLWKGSINKDIGNNVIVQMVGMNSSNHTVYARVDPNCLSASSSDSSSLAAANNVPVGKVIETMVSEGWKSVAREILEKHIHVETPDAFPSATQLLQLGSVWILNETAYAAGDNYHAQRLKPSDETNTPNWKDMTLRVHYVPDRFFVAHEVDWTKYCKGLLLDNGCTSATIGGVKAVVPMTGLPDGKDGVIVYEDNDIGFAVLNKPGGMPCHSTISNHAEDVVSMYQSSLKQRHPDGSEHPFVSVPLRVEPEVHGLLLAATKKEFCHFMTKQLQDNCTSNATNNGITKTYRVLVCVRDPNDIDRIESLVNNQTIIEHHVDVRSPTPKKFVRHAPTSGSNHKWEQCLMKITSVSSQSMNFRAACVRSTYSDSNDFTLAHRLWGPDKQHPAELLGVQYVMQLDVQLLTKAPHQIRGQLAALGVPIVGDGVYGGGVCEMRGHRHMWTRMAVQICHLEFSLPKWDEKVEENDDNSSNKKKVLVVSSPEEEDKRCVFHLNTCWWSEYMMDYERYSLTQAMASTAVSIEE